MHDSLAEFISAAQDIDEVRRIPGASWDLEIGGLTEIIAESGDDPPMVVFDEIADYPAGYRVVSLALASTKRFAMVLGLDPDQPKMTLVRQAVARLHEIDPLPPAQVDGGPIAENTFTGDEINMLKFPSPRYHVQDGGRYIGTGDCIINRDPETGALNVGTYRVQVHDEKQLGLWMSPGQQGRQICEKYWAEGKGCPVVATFGGDLLTFIASHQKLPLGVSEIDYAGGLRKRPVEVLAAQHSDLPIPAHAEIAVEGVVPPPSEESREEGPFGEWPGYYSGGTAGTGDLQPVINVQALYHRTDPIILNMAPMWPGAPLHGIRLDAGLLWEQLESIGIQGIEGVYSHYPYLIVIAINQKYAGHAKQVGFGALGASSAARNGRYIVVVDDDIDPSNLKEVVWAMETRVDPSTDIDIVSGTWSTSLDPRMTPDQRQARDYTNSRAVFYAVRPYAWRDQFPPVSRAPASLKESLLRKFDQVLG